MTEGDALTHAAAVQQPLSASPSGRFGDRVDWRIVMLLLAIAGVTAFFGLLNDYYVAPPHLIGMAREASVLVLVALGANFVIVAGEIDLSPGAVIGLVSVSVPGLLDMGLSAPVALLVGVVIGGAVGAVNGAITLGFMVPSFLATLGTMAIVRGIAIFISEQPSVVYDDLFSRLLSNNIGFLPETLLYALVLVLCAALLWRFSRFSLHVRAVGSSEQSARFAGLSIRRVKLVVFVLGGMLSAAGALLLLGETQTGLADSSQGIELNGIAAAILGGGRLGGGKGSVIGTCLGALLLTMIFSGIAGLGLAAAWQLLTKGVILVVVILLMRA